MSDNGRPILALAFLLVVIFVCAIYIPPLFKPPVPTMEVTSCALASSTMQNNGITSISFSVKNNDANNAHNLTVQFSSYQTVSFMLGSQPLSQQNGQWVYTDALYPSSQLTQSINVQPSLAYGVNSLTYNVYVTFYMDGNQFCSKTLVLNVKS